MAGLCQYKDMFGALGKGAHSYRFLGLAIVDVILTILAGILIAWLTEWSIWPILGGLFLIGILLHRLFCVRTTIDKLLFG